MQCNCAPLLDQSAEGPKLQRSARATRCRAPAAPAGKCIPIAMIIVAVIIIIIIITISSSSSSSTIIIISSQEFIPGYSSKGWQSEGGAVDGGSII